VLGPERRACLASLGDGARDRQGLVGVAEPVEQPGDKVAADQHVARVSLDGKGVGRISKTVVRRVYNALAWVERPRSARGEGTPAG
jgi:hypothetical protein